MARIPWEEQLEHLYGEWPLPEAELKALLDRSLSPRDSTMLVRKLGSLSLKPSHRVLDIGCRDARYACQISMEYACQVLAIDPFELNLQKSNRTILEMKQAERVRVRRGWIEEIPVRDKDFHFVWCRDVLTHVLELTTALQECRRVLMPGGKVLLYHTLATSFLEPGEAARLFEPLAVVPQNLNQEYFERCVQEAGLRIVESESIGSEWRECWEEEGKATTSHQLLRISRMIRNRETLVETLGEALYNIEMANCHWGVYQMLGKLSPHVYVLEPLP
jgi:ubiquinone/menaquinone biosynthesis C-methylase UbiE